MLISDFSFVTYSFANRSAKANQIQSEAVLQAFHREFESQYAMPLTQAHTNLLLKRRTEFVGTKTLNSSLRFFAIAIRKPKIYKPVCQPVLMQILFELSLPLLLTTPREVEVWTEDPIEYVRMQVDRTDHKNVKHATRDLVQAICLIR